MASAALTTRQRMPIGHLRPVDEHVAMDGQKAMDGQGFQEDISILSRQLEAAKEEAELNMAMLQQAQDELEYYFLAYQKQDKLLQQQRAQLQRAEGLILALLERVDQRG